MFQAKCPGQDTRYWTADDAHEESCPHCGEMIEFFKTDIRLRCPSCKERVANSRFDLGCAQWCAYAEQCLGSAAKGLKPHPMRQRLESEFKRMAGDLPSEQEKLNKRIKELEKEHPQKNGALLPEIIAAVIIALEQSGRLKDQNAFLERLHTEHGLPQEAVQEALARVEKARSTNQGE